ncbi:MAG: glycosyltransferase [Bacilli bacterium]|nr:glycosyltransferase [Bacilli bacterium]
MKVLLYTEGLKQIGISGLGRAIKHQMRSLELNNVEYTTDINDKDYDILHVNTFGLKSVSLVKKAKKLGKKVVYHAHSTEEDFRNSFPFSNTLAPLFKKWICKCYKLGDVIVTPTPYSKKLLENYNLNKKIYAVSNGIEIEYFKRDEKLGLEFRKKYNYKKSDKVIMAIGLFIERKGILDFIELARRLPEYKFIWFGTLAPILTPRKIKKAMKNKTSNLEFPGYVQRDVIRGAFSGTDLYIFPTLEETEGIPLLEALALKQTALIRDIPIFDWVINKKDAYKAKNIDEFESITKAFLEGKLPSLAGNGYKKAVELDLKNTGAQLKQIYTDLLKTK